MVDVWYPADTVAGRPPAAYLPDLPAVEKQAGDAGARKQFGAAYEQMIKGEAADSCARGGSVRARPDAAAGVDLFAWPRCSEDQLHRTS